MSGTERDIRLNSECIKCLLNKYLNRLPVEPGEEQKVLYFQRILKIISEADMAVSAPEIVAEVNKLQREMFGKWEEYTEIKKYYNSLLLSLEDKLTEKIGLAEDPLKSAVGYSMMGNYIDFGVMESVEESKLAELLEESHNMKFDLTELENMRKDLRGAKRMVFLTDNCGEVVLDKILIKEIKRENPRLDIDIIVRGMPVLNDATMDDALQIGLDKIARVIPNGSDVAGTCLGKISVDALNIIDSADVIIAKGQGNFETMRYCGKNVYYMFLCKCQLFADRFGMPRFSPMILNDLRMN